MTMNFERARFNMVEQQIRPWEVLDDRVLDTLQRVKREDYVPTRYRNLAFADVEIPLEHSQHMMKPVLEGRLLQSLQLQAEDSVLEIGTGSGFVTACLSSLAREVLSLEYHASLADRARARLEQSGFANARIENVDALRAFTPRQTFDAIVVTGAVHRIPNEWRTWLADGGRLIVIHGSSPAMETLRITRNRDGSFSEESLFETDVPYLIGAEPPQSFTL